MPPYLPISRRNRPCRWSPTAWPRRPRRCSFPIWRKAFDWTANYVARLSEDGKTLDLFAWLTVANGGSQGFADAHTQAVAGAPNKVANAILPKGRRRKLHLQCWPMDITSTHPRWGIRREPRLGLVAESLSVRWTPRISS